MFGPTHSMTLTVVTCSICDQGTAELFENESQRCTVCGAWIANGEITETPDAS